MLPVLWKYGQSMLRIVYDKVMTNVGGKDGACAAAIHLPKAYDILGLAVECDRRVPLASALPEGERKGVESTTSSYRGGAKTADLLVEDPSFGESGRASRLASGGYLSGR
jgi:hypothetical protein